MRCGGRSGRNTAVAATASGGATTAPSAIAAAHGRSRDEQARDGGDSRGGESDRDDDETRDRCPIVLEIPERRVVRRIQENWCDEERERKLGRQRERRRGGKKREQRTAKREEHGIRCPNATRDAGEDDGGDKEDQKLFELTHMTAGRHVHSHTDGHAFV